MESQPQDPEFRNNPENFHPCITIFDLVTRHAPISAQGAVLFVLFL